MYTMSISKDEILRHLILFFPQEKYRESDVDQGLEEGTFIADASSMANKLKGTMHDESIVEVELDGLTRVFFCRILDHPPDPEPEPEDDDTPREGGAPSYEKGSYLNDLDHVIVTPLEPSIGNFLICPAPQVRTRVLLRIIASRQAYELGCHFTAKVNVGGMPVLKLTFPVIARTVENAREFRAKIPGSMLFEVAVEMRGGRKKFSTVPIDISPSGMFLVDPMGRTTDLKPDESVFLEMRVPGYKTVAVEANIRHVTKLRNAKGIQYCFGVQFDLATRALASAIEGMVALVQRTHLRELAEIADKFGIDYENW
jgi:c-di-GMP-binding flagellar brake protein YcgR